LLAKFGAHMFRSDRVIADKVNFKMAATIILDFSKSEEKIVRMLFLVYVPNLVRICAVATEL